MKPTGETFRPRFGRAEFAHRLSGVADHFAEDAITPLEICRSYREPASRLYGKSTGWMG